MSYEIVTHNQYELELLQGKKWIKSGLSTLLLFDLLMVYTYVHNDKQE